MMGVVRAEVWQGAGELAATPVLVRTAGRDMEQAAVEAEVVRVAPPLLEQGGYVPMVDGRVRKYVPYENYRVYRELIQKLAERG